MDKGGRIVELATLGEQRLVEQDIRPVGKALLATLVIQAADQCMARVDLQDRL